MAPASKRARHSLEPRTALSKSQEVMDTDEQAQDDGDEEDSPQPVERDVTRFRILHPLWPKKSKRKRLSLPDTSNCQKEVPLGFPRAEKSVFKISPREEWKSMIRYKRFTITGQSFHIGEIVLVNSSTNVLDSSDVRDHWVGCVMEIRAKDTAHVYIRIYWLYWPEELPGGRQPYHGAKELIPSNSDQIIDAMTVNGGLVVRQWDDSNAKEMPPAKEYYWRQHLSVRPQNLSEATKHCIDERPINPDSAVITCPHCDKLMHSECILEDAVKRANQRHVLEQPGADSSTKSPSFPADSDYPSNLHGLNGVLSPPDSNGTPCEAASRASPAKTKPKSRRKSNTKRSSMSEEDGLREQVETQAFSAELAQDYQIALTDCRLGKGTTTLEKISCLLCLERFPDTDTKASGPIEVPFREIKAESKVESED